MKALSVYPKVSVLVITYNQEKFIRETIESVITQDYPNFEYIIADDGSIDSTPDIILEYAKKYPNIIVPLVGNPNVGITGNSNRGLSRCVGDYIALQGGDDFFLPGKISAQVQWFRQSNRRAICGHLLKICDETSQIIGDHKTHTLSGFGPKLWIQRGTLYGATSVMIRRDILPEYGFDDRLGTVSDWKLYIDSLKEDLEFGLVNEFLGVYRKHSNNVTNNFERCSSDVAKTFDLLVESGDYHDHTIKKGKAYLILYGRGLKHFIDGEFHLAPNFFKQAIQLDPSLWKAYLRLIQCYWAISKKLLFSKKGS
jgi:glycosyltransferase involved in cell wall biosynthesis